VALVFTVPKKSGLLKASQNRIQSSEIWPYIVTHTTEQTK